MTASSSAVDQRFAFGTFGGLILVTGCGTSRLATSGLPAVTTLPQADCHHSGPVRLGHGGRVGQRVGVAERLAVLVEHLEADLAGQHPAEPLVRDGADVGRVVPALLLPLQVGDLGLRRGDVRLERGQVPALLEVGPHARGVGHHQHREDQHQDRGPAGEPGRGAAWPGATPCAAAGRCDAGRCRRPAAAPGRRVGVRREAPRGPDPVVRLRGSCPRPDGRLCDIAAGQRPCAKRGKAPRPA